MVWNVCRRVIHNHQDAENAFEATFLVIVRKATSIVPREMFGNWLFGVAHPTATKANATAAKRRMREKQVTEMPESAMTEQDWWNGLQPVLGHELSRFEPPLPPVLKEVMETNSSLATLPCVSSGIRVAKIASSSTVPGLPPSLGAAWTTIAPWK